jgi:hypothetical protein
MEPTLPETAGRSFAPPFQIVAIQEAVAAFELGEMNPMPSAAFGLSGVVAVDSCPNRVRLQVQHRSTKVLLSFRARGECRRQENSSHPLGGWLLTSGLDAGAEHL